MFALMTVKEIYRFYVVQLQNIYSLNESTVIADWVFESLVQTKRADLIKNPAIELSKQDCCKLNDCLAALLQHKPVQYILEEGWFFNMKLKVNANVLIPRPETEELVKLVLDKALAESVLQPAILDVGTGSGCIAIALKEHLPEAIISAIDISDDALEVAKENAATHQADIHFMLLDFVEEDQWKKLPGFDIIVSNPPYIPENEKEKLDKNVVEFEPHTALFVPDKTPLLFYEKIAAFGLKHLNYNGKIFVETHENFAAETAEIFSANYSAVEIIKDIFGKERMIVAGERYH